MAQDLYMLHVFEIPERVILELKGITGVKSMELKDSIRKFKIESVQTMT